MAIVLPLILSLTLLRKWQPTPVFLPGKFYEQRSLVSYSPWCCKELDTTERLHFRFQLKFRPTVFLQTWSPAASWWFILFLSRLSLFYFLIIYIYIYIIYIFYYIYLCYFSVTFPYSSSLCSLTSDHQEDLGATNNLPWCESSLLLGSLLLDSPDP